MRVVRSVKEGKVLPSTLLRKLGSPIAWLTLAWVLVVGPVAMMPIGAIFGSLVTNPQSMALMMLPTSGLVAISGIFSESSVSTSKAEPVDRHRFPTREAARVTIFEYVEGFYNRNRRHSSSGYESPVDYEAATMEGAAVA